MTPVKTATRVVLLQHPRERDVAIGTARMASLCLPNAELHVGVHWSGSQALARATSDPTRPAVLLYPGDGAIDVVSSPPPGPVTLIVVDGTWSQTKKVVRENPELRALPRYAFRPPSPSEYRIRKEPRESYVSTIEALVHVLGALERDPQRFLALLDPFRAMVDVQIDCRTRLHGARVRHARPGPRRPHVAAELDRRRSDLVCVVGEANAWPYRTEERQAAFPDELVHWAAQRLSTGETFEFVVAPSHPLAPRTVDYTELSADELAAGGDVRELAAKWRAFVRDDDVICSWGHYATRLFASAGGFLPRYRVDLRQMARTAARRKIGTLESFAGSVSSDGRRMGRGRAGVRLGHSVEVAIHLANLGREASSS